jgi:hypothetical protein
VRNNVNSIWTVDRTEMLRKLWDNGYSCSQIAAEMGCGLTRNAIIGKVHRLKLERRYWGNGSTRLINPTPPATPRRQLRPRRPKATPVPKILWATSNITGHFVSQPRKQRAPELTKNEMRAMLTLAVQNTAAMEVIS